MKIAYIAHPIGGDVKRNVNRILSICKDINLSENDTVPFAPYLVDVMAMDDSILEQRKRGIKNNAHLFSKGFIDEVRLYGSEISPGMHEEINLAKKYGIPVFSMNIENHLHILKVKCSELYENKLKNSLKHVTGVSPLQTLIARIKEFENKVLILTENDTNP